MPEPCLKSPYVKLRQHLQSSHDFNDLIRGRPQDKVDGANLEESNLVYEMLHPKIMMESS